MYKTFYAHSILYVITFSLFWMIPVNLKRQTLASFKRYLKDVWKDSTLERSLLPFTFN